MQRSSLPPPHPSLPAAPLLPNSIQNDAPEFHMPPHTISTAVTTTSSTPHLSYPQLHSVYSSHYAQAYLQPTASGFPAQIEGRYGHFSTHNPTASCSLLPTYFAESNYMTRKGNSEAEHLGPRSFSHLTSHSSQLGYSQCAYKNCTFSGSHKVVELHMMDRHLIYPPGWEKRTKKTEWDADPSLKGKRIPIQGTTVILDTPEAVETWIAERKKRWPSADRVEERKRKIEEAIARGQLSMDGSDLLGRKKHRMTENAIERGETAYQHQNSSGRSKRRGRGRCRGIDSGRSRRYGETTAIQRRSTIYQASPVVQSNLAGLSSNSGGVDDKDDDEPEVASSRPPPETIDSAISNQAKEEDIAKCGLGGDCGNGCVVHGVSEENKCRTLQPYKKRFQQQPKKSHNPFASRPTLLRNLLLPEIRMTISNLSQAVRFLVDNDFLDGIELSPGERDETMIEVISSCSEGDECKSTEASTLP